MSCVLELKNISFVYGKGTPFEKRAVDNVSLSIERGELIGVIGHTGSGKSTLMQTLNGLMRPTEGQVFLDGKDIWEKPKKIREVRFKVGMVFQYPEYQLFEETVYKDIAFGAQNMGLTGDDLDKAVRDAAAFTDLKPALLDKSPFDLSGGEKRRAAIAGVIAMEHHPARQPHHGGHSPRGGQDNRDEQGQACYVRADQGGFPPRRRA